ncbi:MAG TPA: hypothetical protein VIK31_11025 [Propionibacteriaceae bacterium]
MSRRSILISVLIVALVALVSLAFLLPSCAAKVRVETGERIVCTYGEITTDTIHTIEVPAADAGKYKVVRETVICPRHKLLESLYAEAQAAIVSGDMTTARAKLAEVVKLEPQFRNAQQQIDAIDAGKTPIVDTGLLKPSSTMTITSGTTSNPGGSASAPEKQPVGPVASLSSWVPAVLPGYTAAPIVADVFTLTRQYKPAAGMPTDALVVVVEQYKDATAAKNAIKYDLGASYSTGTQTLSVNGRSVYFGTDGRRFAIAAWNENGVLIVVEGSSKTGKPAELKSHLSSLVSAITK